MGINLSTTTVAVIGAGPAGMAAALQLQRFGVATILFEQTKHGSLLQNAWRVENYLGCYPGKTGAELLRQFQENLRKNCIKTTKNKVQSLDYNCKSKLFKITTQHKTYVVDYVIVASGTKPKVLLKNFPATIGSQLFYAVSPLLKKRRKTIVIIGAGDAAFDNALNLARHNKVIICNRTKHSSALPLLQEKALQHCNITYLQDYKLQDIFAIISNRRLGLKFTSCKKNMEIEADYLVVAIGRLPQKDFYTAKLLAAEKRLVQAGKLVLAGDVNNKIYRQVAIAAGDGIKAAMQIFSEINQ